MTAGPTRTPGRGPRWTGFAAVLAIAGIVVYRLGRELRRARRLADTDPLTGTGNRRVALALLARDTVGAVALVDLDRFKHINDAYGHSTGDGVLTAVAARLRDTLGPHATVTRLGATNSPSYGGTHPATSTPRPDGYGQR